MAPNKSGIECVNAHCILPYIQMVIRPDGKVSLCCNDALGKYTLGDVTKEKIKNIWAGDGYQFIRKEMRINKRVNIDLCKNCDAVSYRMD